LVISLKGANPYKMPAGSELDQIVHDLLFTELRTNNPPPYSTDLRSAEKVKTKLKALFGHAVVTGHTKLKNKPHFARFETGPSTSTEVLAETVPLAVCRLALLIAPGRERAT
jgi:hypothetical protein